MERTFFSFLLINLLLCFPRIQCDPKVVSACYGIGDCSFLHLSCEGGKSIKIVSAQYGLNNDTSCTTTSMLQNCSRQYQKKCCVPSKDYRAENYTLDNWNLLDGKCTGNESCTSGAVRGGQGWSNIATVTYTCRKGFQEGTTKGSTAGTTKGSPEGGTTAGHEALPGSKDTNTAAIVAPIVVVLLIVVVAAVLFYWRRKQQLGKGSRKHEDQANHTLHTTMHNPGYFDAEKAKGTSKDVNDGDLDPENTYHTIDPNSIPVQVTANDYLVLDPEDEYNVIDPNDIDNGQVTVTTNEYFILEPEGQTTDKEENPEADYNKLSLKGNEIVKDPNYQRLAAVDQSSKDKPKENENYSHINGDKFSAEVKDTENKEGNENEIQVNTHHADLNDDYSHLDNKSNF